MKPILAAAGLILALTAATQANAQPFLYLGAGGNLAILTTEAKGPATARTFTVAIAVGAQKGPGGSDTFITEMRADCKAETLQLLSTAAFAGDTALPIEDEPGAPSKAEKGTPFRDLYDYACTGAAPEGASVWIEGPDAARAYAHERALEIQ